MTEKRFNARKNIDNDYFEERLKVVLEDIVGSVHSDDVTNSVELKKEYYKSRMTENKRYSEQNLENHLNRIYDNHEGKVIFDDKIIDLLNEQEETIQNQKGYIILLEEKLEENGIRLEPKDFY